MPAKAALGPLLMALGTAGSGALGSIFAPEGQRISSFKKGHLTPFDPEVLLGDTRVGAEDYGRLVTGLINRATTLPTSYVRAPPTLTGGGLPMPIGVTGRDPAERNRNLLTIPGIDFDPELFKSPEQRGRGRGRDREREREREREPRKIDADEPHSLLPATDGDVALDSMQSFNGVPGGFDPDKWNDPGYNSPKYQIGRLLAQYQSDPAGLLAAVKGLDPDATFDMKDLLNLPNLLKGDPYGTEIDVYTDEEGQRVPAWQPVNRRSPGVTPGVTPRGTTTPTRPRTPSFYESYSPALGSSGGSIPTVKPIGGDLISSLMSQQADTPQIDPTLPRQPGTLPGAVPTQRRPLKGAGGLGDMNQALAAFQLLGMNFS